MVQTIDYILSFLLGSDLKSGWVGYTSDKDEWHNYKVVIKPSDFFDSNVFLTQKSLPKLPLKSVEGVPVLFGDDKVTDIDGTLVVEADIVAGAYFMLSRYEELVVKERDSHGRFPAESSTAVKAGFLSRPIVDEYGELLRKWLLSQGVAVGPRESRYKFLMTHDIDLPAQYRRLRGFCGGVLRGDFKTAFNSYFRGVEYDPLFTFDYMRQCESGVDTKIFLKVAGGRLPQDLPWFNPYSDDIKRILELFPDAGLHISYESSLDKSRIPNELKRCSEIVGYNVTSSRNHFLASLEPSSLQALTEVGITDDYTMGFAGSAGFRLGTSRPVRRIEPETGALTSLTLHPLVVMDCSLFDERYMNLNSDEAVELCKKLNKAAREFGGEFVALWHNNNIAANADPRYKTVYNKIIDIFS